MYHLKQAITLYRLVGIGYAEINRYTDGVVLVENPAGMRTFVRPDGTVTKPHTTATMLAYAKLLNADIKVAQPDIEVAR